MDIKLKKIFLCLLGLKEFKINKYVDIKNRSFRLELLKNWHFITEEKVVDFTTYHIPEKEAKDAAP